MKFIKNVYIKFISISGVLVFMLSCNGDQGGLPLDIKDLDNLVNLSDQEHELSEFQFRKEMVFRDSLLLDAISDVAVDDDGRVYIAGSGWNRRQVHIFNEDGSYLDSLGQYGTDLGEFLEIHRIQWINNALYLTDETLKRVTKYNLVQGEWSDSMELMISDLLDFVEDNESRFKASPAGMLNSERILIAARELRNQNIQPESRIQYFSAGIHGDIVAEKIVELDDIRYLIGDYAGKPASFLLNYPEQPLATISESNNLFIAHTNEFLIRKYDRYGHLEKAYYYPFDRATLNPEEIIHPRFSHNDQILRVRESAEYPDYWPALNSLLIDDKNRIWVSTINNDRNQLEWWVIDDLNGYLVTRFHWPSDSPIIKVKGDKIYTIEKNKMGFSEIVKYSLIQNN